MSDVKVGDVVAWRDVPDGALVRQGRFYYLRIKAKGWCVYSADAWRAFARWLDGAESKPWAWHGAGDVTIIALGLTGQETAAELQRLALLNLPIAAIGREFADPQVLAERLHRAGWRPGMTAADAARLLAEVRDG